MSDPVEPSPKVRNAPPNAGTAAGTAAPNHSPRFFVDEDNLPLGVRTLLALALDWLASNA